MTTDTLRRDAAVSQGKIKAGINLPELPVDCRVQEPHAPDPVGAEVRTILKAERQVTNRANARVLRCAANYDNVRTAFGAGL